MKQKLIILAGILIAGAVTAVVSLTPGTSPTHMTSNTKSSSITKPISSPASLSTDSASVASTPVAQPAAVAPLPPKVILDLDSTDYLKTVTFNAQGAFTPLFSPPGSWQVTYSYSCVSIPYISTYQRMFMFVFAQDPADNLYKYPIDQYQDAPPPLGESRTIVRNYAADAIAQQFPAGTLPQGVTTSILSAYTLRLPNDSCHWHVLIENT